MEKEKLYDQIEQYLEGSLQGAEAAAFEQGLQKDAKLAAEVELHRKMQKALGDPQKLELREKLHTISNNYNQQESGATIRSLRSRYQVILIAASIALALGLLYWLIDSGDGVNPSNESILTEEQSDPSESDLPEIQTPPQEELAEDQPEDNQPEIRPDPVPESNQLANNFELNPTLEAIIGNADKTKDFEFDLEVASQKNANGKVQFQLEGLAEAAGLSEGEKLQLSFFNNDASAYTNGQPVFDAELDVTESDEAPIEAFGKQYLTYDLKYDSTLNLQPGVYYYIIRKEGTNEPLYVGKIVVE